MISKVRPDCWYCPNCRNYFKNINGKKPNYISLFELLKLEETPELQWEADEINNAKDLALAKFYGMLNDGDRYDFISHHIDIHRDFRTAALLEAVIDSTGFVEPYQGPYEGTK